MVPSKPEPNLIRSSQDAEASACTWMRYWGYSDAHLTVGGADGGVDVRSTRAVAQVKAEMKPTGRPTVQQLAGIASYEKVEAIFFSLAGFTDEAAAWATDAGIALFSFDLSGEPEPLNAKAHSLAAFSNSDLAVESGGRDALSDRIRRGIETQAHFSIGGTSLPSPEEGSVSDGGTWWDLQVRTPVGHPPTTGWREESWSCILIVSPSPEALERYRRIEGREAPALPDLTRWFNPEDGSNEWWSWNPKSGSDVASVVSTLFQILADLGHTIDDFTLDLQSQCDPHAEAERENGKLIMPSSVVELQAHMGQLRSHGRRGRIIAKWSMGVEETDPDLQSWVAQMQLEGSDRPSWEWEIAQHEHNSGQWILWARAAVPVETITARDRSRFGWEEEAVQHGTSLRRWVMETSREGALAACTKALLKSMKVELSYFEIREMDDGPTRWR